MKGSFRGVLALMLAAALVAAAHGAARFERIGPFGGDVRSLVRSRHAPDTLYLGTTDGTIYQSTDGAASWSPLFPGIGKRQFVIDTLVEHPTEAGHIYAGGWELRSSGGGLFESGDAGRSWRPVPLPGGRPAVRDLAICARSPAHMVVGALEGVYVSEDGGKRWRSVGVQSPGFRDVESVAIDPRNPRIVYAGTWRLGYRSLDFGATWARVGEGMLLDSDLFSLAVDPRAPEIVYASACSGVYRSANRAGLWKRLRLVPDRFAVRAHVVVVDPVAPHRVYTGTTEGLFASDDDGVKWTRLTSRFLTVNAVQIDPRDNRRLLLGTDDAGVLRSDDAGRTWRPANTGFVQRQISRIVPDPEVAGRWFAGLVADGREGGFYRYEDPGGRWEPQTAEIVADVPEVLSFLPLGRGRGRLAGSVRGIYWQASAGDRWRKLAGPVAGLGIRDLALDAGGGNVVAATSAGLYRSAAAPLAFAPVSGAAAPALALARGTGGMLFAGTESGLVASRDDGGQWTLVSAALSGRSAAQALALCPAEEGHLLAGTRQGLFESRDGGASWQRGRDGRLGVDIASVAFLDGSGKRLAAADNAFGGVLLSVDGGATWDKVEAPTFASPARCLWAAGPNLLYVGTHADGVYRIALEPEAVTLGSGAAAQSASAPR